MEDELHKFRTLSRIASENLKLETISELSLAKLNLIQLLNLYDRTIDYSLELKTSVKTELLKRMTK